ncbi:spermidine synthase [Inhella gelatinilytica]|uniref:Spermidine synthase n=1 Tax=Inhella gelatinilytica TaxID=2795030 RepID=A0A931IXT9_9BURK|nr:spermidine synthase [Inhella gelatinilytica]MBH9554154.1 spermidine synthase [Inhella gelatinilytica]
MQDEDFMPEVSISEYAGVRSLHLNSIWIQGSMRLSKPLKLELDYIQRMMAPLLWQAPATWREGLCVQLGLGAAALTKYCLQVLDRPTIAVELNPNVVRVCERYFELPLDHDQLRLCLADAGDWVQHVDLAGQVRLLHIDLYDHEAAAPVIDDVAFYAACRDLLSDDGVLSVNLFGRQVSFERSCQRLLEAFGPGRVWRLSSTKEGNTVVVASRASSLPPKDELQRRATALEASQGLPAKRWLRGLREVVAAEPIA